MRKLFLLLLQNFPRFFLVKYQYTFAKVLIQSSDGSGREKSRLRTPDGGSYIGWLNSKELGKAFGRENITHCALASGGLTQRIVEDAQRLKGLRIVKDQNSFRKDEKSK